MSAIVFGSPPDAHGARVVAVPDTLPSRDDLFGLLATGLDFPPNSGRNWDALFDLLSDLTWLTDEEVWIVHNAMPKRPMADFWDTYLDVLADAVARRNTGVGRGFDDRPKLVIFLPDAALARLRR